MNILLTTLAVLVLLSGVGPAALAAEKWRGYLVDRQCADSVRDDHDPRDFIRHHTKDCALMPNCRARGYSLYSGNKWLDLDKKGNEMAFKVLKASKKSSGFYVEVTGLAQGNVLKTQSIREIGEAQAR